MNTADRSIALVDHALRRRFSFVFLGPNYERLAKWLQYKNIDDGGQLVSVLRKINQRIADRHYEIGTSYFLAAGGDLPRLMREIWEGEIEPHLDEYFFDQKGVVEEFRWTVISETDMTWWGTETSKLN
jgi:5-methylcytosine-specific restriction protein B